MRGRLIALVLVLVCLFNLHIVLLDRASIGKKLLPSADSGGFIILSPVVKITSLEFDGLVSDILFMKVMIFEGGTYERKEQPRVKPEEWQWLSDLLAVSTDLDPYFFDPYFFANAHLTWEAGLFHETNDLLAKGARFRNNDWMLPFFIGFNNFYFLKDDAKAAEWLMTAAERPGPSEKLASLASKLAFKEKKTENAIFFLEAILRKTDEYQLRKEYETRIKALRARLQLEESASFYKRTFGRLPKSLVDLVEKGMLKELPKDPYGGSFSINDEGQIVATSDHLLLPVQRQ